MKNDAKKVLLVQCTRCRNKHRLIDRVDTAPDKTG